MITEIWLLWLYPFLGAPTIVPMPTELACDRERAAIVREIAAAEAQGLCPIVVETACTPALATPAFLEDAR